jgi:chaperonin GroES
MPSLIVDDAHTVSAPKDATLRPINNRILVKMDVPEALHKGILWIPEQCREDPQKGEIVAIGPGDYAHKTEIIGERSYRRLTTGKRIAPDLKAGDKIMIAKYCGHDVNFGTEPHVMCRENDVLGTMVDGVFKPLHNQVAIRMDAPALMSGRLHLPAGVKKDTAATGTVVAVGVGWKLKTGAIVEMGINVGDRIVFSAYAGEEHLIGEETLKLVPVEHCLATLST